MISVSFNAAKEDLLAFTCYYYGMSPTVRRSRVATQFGISLVLAGAGILVLVKRGGEIRSLGVVLLVCVLCLTPIGIARY